MNQPSKGRQMATTKEPLSYTAAVNTGIDFTLAAAPPPRAIRHNRRRAVWKPRIIECRARRPASAMRLERSQLNPEPGMPVFEDVRPDRLRAARFVAPASVELTFADDFKATLPVSRLEMPGRIRWQTVRLTDGGDTMTVSGVPGDEIPIPASTIRYLVDADFATGKKARRPKGRLTRDQLRKLAEQNPPPPELFDQPAHDLIRDTWK
jgi:hypothetical protein